MPAKRDLIRSHITDIITPKKYSELEKYCKTLGYECSKYTMFSAVVTNGEKKAKVVQKRGQLILDSYDENLIDNEDVTKYIRTMNKLSRLKPIVKAEHRDILKVMCGVLYLENY